MFEKHWSMCVVEYLVTFFFFCIDMVLFYWGKTRLWDSIYIRYSLCFFKSSTFPFTFRLSEYQVSDVVAVFQSLSHVQLFATPWTTACQALLSFTIPQSLLKLMSMELVMPSNHLVHLLSSPSPLASSLVQHQGLFQWVSSSHQVAKVLELQHHSFQWIFRVDFLEDGLVGSPCSPGDSQESSPTPQFKSINSSALSSLYGSTLMCIHDY